MSHKDLLRDHDYTTLVVEADDEPRLQMKCKCRWVKLLKIKSWIGTGVRVTWHVHCQEVLANHS